MKVLLDSHLLIWLVGASDRLPKAARDAIENPDNPIHFSSASIWELSIKHASGKARLALPQMLLYEKLKDNGFTEVPVTAAHGLKTASLPAIHKDPFDRILIAQAMSDGMTLLTSDETVALYNAPVQLVR